MPPTAENSGRVFVSSTCYDLIDARASVERTLKDAGLTPVMSDRPTSEFEVPGDGNSIETCLVNLRSCEHCIVILSQRYGPSLAKSGFGDFSATHMEYREALAHGIPVVMYVRDRLMAEFELQKRTPELKPVWAREGDAKRLYKFIEEHKALENGPKPNWIWTFSNSDELGQRITRDLGLTAARARIRALTERGALPLLSIRTTAPRQGDRHAAQIRNLGSAVAIGVRIRQPDGKEVMPSTDLMCANTFDFTFVLDVAAYSQPGAGAPVLFVDYETASGDSLRDLFAVLFDRGPCRVVPVGRELVGASLRARSPAVTSVAGLAMVDMKPINDAYDRGTISSPTK